MDNFIKAMIVFILLGLAVLWYAFSQEQKRVDTCSDADGVAIETYFSSEVVCVPRSALINMGE